MTMTDEVINETAVEPEAQLYVILTRISYKSMIPAEREIIEKPEDPYAEDARKITLDHLGPADINRLIMRRIVAPYDG